MKAITKSTYGGPEVLKLKEVEKPVVKEGHVLVKVKANSANPADWHIMRGEPILARFAFGLFKPKQEILGADFSGIVEEIGEGVTRFKVGDHVFGEQLKAGAFAEFTCAPEGVCAKIPDGIGFQEMAAMPIAGITALQEIVTHGKLQKGESVLINGSSGGVGHFAVQIAKAYGAVVTAVCSQKNSNFVKALGADHVLAYDKNNIHEHKEKYDLVIDNHGNLNLDDFKRMGKRGVVVGFTTMKNMMALMLSAALSKFSLTQFTAEANAKDLETLAELIKNESIKPHIEKTFTAEQIPDAIGYIEAMHTQGKVVMVW